MTILINLINLNESQCLMKGLLSCTDIFFLGDLEEGIEKNTKDENKDNVKEADV